MVLFLASGLIGLAPGAKGQSFGDRSATDQARRGVIVDDPRASPGYTLIAPLDSRKTYLIDLKGRVVRSWESRYPAGQSAYLLASGHLLRAARLEPAEQLFAGLAREGRVQEFTWDGELIWDFKFHDEQRLAHHDICPMPNGNVLLIAWEVKTAEQVLAAGRKADTVQGPSLADMIVEVKPMGLTTGQVVWEWHVWDHLIQDHDHSKANFGDVAQHPELIDVNFGDDGNLFGGRGPFGGPRRPPGGPVREDNATKKDNVRAKEQLEKLQSIGYVGRAGARRNRGFLPDLTHINAVAYNAELDQIMLSPRYFSEFWVIDHGTTTAEAVGHQHGRSGKGGDLLYRWGNPRAYRAGTVADQRLFYQHDAHWIPKGRPGAGHIIVFNNGGGRPDHNFSTVDEVVSPIDSRSQYARDPRTPFGPREPVWSYTSPRKEDFFDNIMSGANRLPNGDTLICDSLRGTIFEVTPAKEVVWKFINPERGPSRFGGSSGLPAARSGVLPAGDAPLLAEILPGMAQRALELKDDQRGRIEALCKEAAGRLETILSAGQKRQLRDRRRSDPFGSSRTATAGQLIPLPEQVTLQLSAEQRKDLAALQADVDARLGEILDAVQKQRLNAVRQRTSRGGPLRLGDTPGGGQVFRAYRYAPDYAGLVGRELTPGATIEELEQIGAASR
jgi:hypothetical protein